MDGVQVEEMEGEGEAEIVAVEGLRESEGLRLRERVEELLWEQVGVGLTLNDRDGDAVREWESDIVGLWVISADGVGVALLDTEGLWVRVGEHEIV